MNIESHFIAFPSKEELIRRTLSFFAGDIARQLPPAAVSLNDQVLADIRDHLRDKLHVDVRNEEHARAFCLGVMITVDTLVRQTTSDTRPSQTISNVCQTALQLTQDAK